MELRAQLSGAGSFLPHGFSDETQTGGPGGNSFTH